DYKTKVKEKLGLPIDKKVILYAPTWRDDQYHGPGQYKFLLQLDLNRLREELSDEYVIALRMHYFISDNLDLSEFEGFAFDFSKLQKPILFYTYDLDKYKDVLRGFYIDMEKDLPGPLLFDSEQVIDSIKHVDSIKRNYKEKYDKFYNTFCKLEDGKATERV